MTVDDRTRLQLHRKLESVLGPEEAATLMALLRPVNRDAVTADGTVTGGELRREMADLRIVLTTAMVDHLIQLTTAMADHRIKVTSAIADLRTELQSRWPKSARG